MPEEDSKFIARARLLEIAEEEYAEEPSADTYTYDDTHHETVHSAGPTVHRVEVLQSPYLDVFYGHHAVRLTLDWGTTANMIRAAATLYLGIPVSPTTQGANQADGETPLNVVVGVRIIATRDSHEFLLEALVIEALDVDVLAGVPFMHPHDVTVCIRFGELILSDGKRYLYQCLLSVTCPPCSPEYYHNLTRGTYWSTTSSREIPIWWPSVGWTPWYQTHPKYHNQEAWPQSAFLTCLMTQLFCIKMIIFVEWAIQNNTHLIVPLSQTSAPPPPPSPSGHAYEDNNTYLSISVDPESLFSEPLRHKFIDVNKTYNSVFRHDIKVYNGAAGPLEAVVNMGPVQPLQRKGHLLLYIAETSWLNFKRNVMNWSGFKYCFAQRT